MVCATHHFSQLELESVLVVNIVLAASFVKIFMVVLFRYTISEMAVGHQLPPLFLAPRDVILNVPLSNSFRIWASMLYARYNNLLTISQSKSSGPQLRCLWHQYS